MDLQEKMTTEHISQANRIRRPTDVNPFVNTVVVIHFLRDEKVAPAQKK
jgi:hypothetical protein